MATIRTTQCRTNAEATFRKVQSISNRAPNAIVRNPPDERLIHSALEDQVLDQASDRIIGKGGYNGCVQTKTALQSPSDVVLTASFVHVELARRPDPAVSGIETQHHFA